MNGKDTMMEMMPETQALNGQDRFNYLARYGVSNAQLQAVVEFEERLDEEILKRAVRLSVDMEPVLGCRVVVSGNSAYWQWMDEPDREVWFQAELSHDRERAIEGFLKGSFTAEGQQVNVRLIRHQEGDTLCVKIDHAATDGAGVKQYLQLLARIYTNLRQDPGFVLLPNVEGRRDQKNYFEAVGVKEPMALFNPQAEMLPPTWAFPYHGLDVKDMHFSMRRFCGETFDRVKNYAKSRGVTINTVLLTAFYRSLFELNQPAPGEDMEIYVTSDLRKALGAERKQGISNLSSMLVVRVSRVPGESFQKTMIRISARIEELKKRQAELTTAVMMEALGMIDFQQVSGFLHGARQKTIDTGKNSPLLSNVGVIQPLHFGENTAEDAYIVTPSLYAPGFMLGASTYNRNLTLEVSFCEPSHSRVDVDKCLNHMEMEIASL